MKKSWTVPIVQASWSLATEITYATVPAWYNSTFRDLKCSLAIPKVRTPGQRYPLLIWVCGGAFKVMDKDVWWPQWMNFARQGCIVASVEYRTSNEAIFPGALMDVKAAIRFLKANAEMFSIDPDNVFIAGESAGGTLANLVGVYGNTREYDQGAHLDQSSSVQGVVDFYGGTDLTVPSGDRTNPLVAGAEENFIGIGDDFNAQAREASAALHVSEDTPPFLIFHGDADEIVYLSQSETLYDALVQNGVPVSFYVFEGAGHGTDEFYQEPAMKLIWDFMISCTG